MTYIDAPRAIAARSTIFCAMQKSPHRVMGGGSADVGDLSALPHTPGISALLSKGWEGPAAKSERSTKRAQTLLLSPAASAKISSLPLIADRLLLRLDEHHQDLWHHAIKDHCISSFFALQCCFQCIHVRHIHQ